mmetsp:Transcript_15342/g.51628  ORF Transcript_15342/g.51628 Transcript_15342/m.51628 type:complete len:604 (-) Transcript_15342:231-2042(-)
MNQDRWVRCFADGLVFEHLGSSERLFLRHGAGDDFSAEVIPVEESTVDESAPKVFIEGIFGVYELLSGFRVALVLESEPLFAGVECGAAELSTLRRVTKIGLAPMFMSAKKSQKRLHSSVKGDAALQEKLLCRALTEQPFVYSLESSVATVSTARRDARDAMQHARDADDDDAPEKKGPAAWREADARFLWNKRVVVPLQKRAGVAALDFCVAVASAIVTVLPDGLPLVLISRLSATNVATRLTRRGLGDSTAPTALVETEALVLTTGEPLNAAMVRCSPPVRFGGSLSAHGKAAVDVSDDDSDHDDDGDHDTRADVADLTKFVDFCRAAYGRDLTLVDLMARQPADVEACRLRLKAAAAKVAAAKAGAKLRHVIVDPMSKMMQKLPIDADLRRGDLLVFCGCDELDDVDDAMAECMEKALCFADAETHLFAAADLRGEVRRAWRQHADGLAHVRSRSRAVLLGDGAVKKCCVLAYRDFLGALVEGSRLDGLELMLGVHVPDPHRRASSVTYPYEAHDAFALRVAALFAALTAAIFYVVETTLKSALTCAAWIVLQCLAIHFGPSLLDGSLAIRLASTRRYGGAVGSGFATPLAAARRSAPVL